MNNLFVKRMLVSLLLTSWFLSSSSVFAEVFENGVAQNGGAKYVNQGENFDVEAESTFTHNTSTAQNYGGGAIFSNGGTVNIGNGTSFIENYINQPVSESDIKDYRSAGGAIASWNGGTLTIGEDVSFVNNGYNSITGKPSWSAGGAIYVDTNGTDLAQFSIGSGSSFVGNVAGSLGGAIYTADSNTQIVSTTFDGNKAGMWGGAIFTGQYSAISGNNTEIIGSSAFKNNEAGSYGGAIASQYTTLNIGDGTNLISFDNNKAGIDGGAIHVTTDSDASYAASSSVKNVVFTNNQAKTGSGGAIYNPADMILEDVSFGEILTDSEGNIIGAQNGNIAASQGGAIMNAAGADTTLSGSVIFAGNSASQGGAISNIGATLNVAGDKNIFVGNTATGNGGAIYVADLDGNISDVVIGGNTEFKNNASSDKGGAIYNAANNLTLDTTAGDITFANNTANNVANDIYAFDGSNTYLKDTNLKDTNTVSIGSGIAGTANAVITNESANLVLETGSLNKNYMGTYNQTAGSTEVNTQFFGGTSNINGGDLNLNKDAEIVADSIVVMGGGNMNINADSENSGTVTINGAITSAAQGNSTKITMNDGNLVINGDMSGYTGIFEQDGDVDATTTINFGATFFGGQNYIKSGTLVVKQGANLAKDITINDYSVALDLDGREYVLSVDGIQISQNGSIKGALNLENTDVKVDETTGIQSDIYVGQGSTLVNKDKSTELAVGDASHNVTVSLGSGFETTEDHVFNVANGSTVSLTPNADSEKAGGTLTLNGSIKGGADAYVLVDGTELKTGEGKYTTGTVIINSINDQFKGNYEHNDGTVIVNDGAVFFAGTNNVNTVVDQTSREVTSGSLVLEDGALLSNGVRINGDSKASVGDLASVTFKGDVTGKSPVANDITQEDIENGAFNYAATKPGLGAVQVNNAGVLFSNGTIIKELDAATNSLVLRNDKGVRLIGFGNGSGVEGDVTLREQTGLVYTDGAYINNDTTLNMTNADLVFANNSSDIKYDVTVAEGSSGNISMYGSGTTSVSSKLNGKINVASENGVLNLDNRTTTDLGSVRANEGTINLKADNVKVKDVSVTGQNAAANFSGNVTSGGNASVSDNGTLGLFGNANFDSLSANNGSLNLTNGAVNTVNVDSMIVNGDSSIFFDADPRSQLTDTIIVGDGTGSITAGTGTADDPYKQVIVGGINFTQSPIDRNVQFDISNLIQGNSTNPNLIRLPDGGIVTNTAMGQYLLTSSGAGTPMVTANLTYLNPQMYRGQVATIATWQNQLLVNNLLFDHMNLVTRKLMDEERTANKYAAAIPQIDPYQYNLQDGSLWFKAYGAFETLSMTKGLNVGNNAYGSIIGADFPLVNLKNGWKLVPTAYIGYNGAHQHFNGVSMYQNGAQLGIMGTAYKGDFMTSLLAYGGGYANDMTVRGEYGNGSDTTGNWFAGVASKSAYNIRLPHDFIIQPAFMAAYNAFGQQNWGSNFGSMSMSSGMLNGLNVAPGLNFIWQKKTFSIYAMTQLVYNVMGGVDGKAGNIDLGYVRMRHCYFEYGLGVMKKFKDTFSGYLQFTIRNGGRTGIGFSGGLQWKVGK